MVSLRNMSEIELNSYFKKKCIELASVEYDILCFALGCNNDLDCWNAENMAFLLSMEIESIKKMASFRGFSVSV
jgi:hypothetical protein